MFSQTFAILRNTYFESIRQPIVLVILAVASIMLIMCNQLSGFTMDDDQKMMIDLGLATVFASGTILAAFIATSVLTREIENRTVLTVVAKPVPRPVFVLAKYFGVALALVVCSLYLSFLFLLVEMHQVQQRVTDPYHLPVIVFTSGAFFISIGAGVWCNYFYGKSFVSTVISTAMPTFAIAYVLCLPFDHEFHGQSIGTAFDGQLWLAITALLVAILVLTSIAVALSTRLSQLMTIAITIGMFIVGLLSDWLFASNMKSMSETWDDRRAALEAAGSSASDVANWYELLLYGFLKFGHSVVPNIQVLYLSDAVTQEHAITGEYFTHALILGAIYIAMSLSLAVALFQRREVG